MTETVLHAVGDLQAAVGALHDELWADSTIEIEMLSVGEEVGEAMRCLVKRHHGHRGTREQWTAEFRKEMAQAVVTLLSCAHMEDFDLLAEVWNEVERLWKRDVNHDPIGAHA